MALLWWLSFRDPDRPTGQSFLGVSIVPTGAKHVANAVGLAWKLGCNPGGEVAGYRLSKEQSALVPREAIGRVLSAEEATDLQERLGTEAA